MIYLLRLCLFQSTLSARRATFVLGYCYLIYIISIHALREESDNGVNCIINWTGISIHALREESDDRASNAVKYINSGIFQSTLSARRATAASKWLRLNKINFNPRSPRGERLLLRIYDKKAEQFQSTLSARRATTQAKKERGIKNDFNPRSPRGERPGQK